MAEPISKEYTDPIYGPCVSDIAKCPDCKGESPVYVKPKNSKAATVPACADNCYSCPNN